MAEAKKKAKQAPKVDEGVKVTRHLDRDPNDPRRPIPQEKLKSLNDK